MSADQQPACPTCGAPLPGRPGEILSEDYRALRRKEVAETVASFRQRAAQHDDAGRLAAASVWRNEADLLERECAKVWGKGASTEGN